MCYFVAIGIDEEFVDVLQQSKPDLLALKPVANLSIIRLFMPKVAFWTGTAGMCDCGFYYALAAPDEEESEDERISRFKRTRQKRGWSTKKIERALPTSMSARGHRAVGVQESMEALRVAQFLSWMREVVSRVGEAVVLAHRYRGYIQEKEVRVEGHLTITISELLERNRHIEAEHIVHLVARRPQSDSRQTQIR